MKVGAIIKNDDIDYWGLAQEFIDNQKTNETRITLYRETFIELHINPKKDIGTTDEINVAALRKDFK
jgi:hypothetical protein